MRRNTNTKSLVLLATIVFIGTNIYPCNSGITSNFVKNGELYNKKIEFNEMLVFNDMYQSSFNETCKWGQEFEKWEGDVETSGDYAVRMGRDPFGSDATVWYKISVGCDSNEVIEDTLNVAIYFCDWGIFGDGPNIYIKNQITTLWKEIGRDIGSNDQMQWWWSDNLSFSNNYIKDGQVEVKVWAESLDDTVVEQVCIQFECKGLPAPGPDLNCIGSIISRNVKVGAEVTSTFWIENIGDPSSNLSWKIKEYPEWGSSWLFTPSNGSNLKPNDGPVNITVSFNAPYETRNYYGNIKVINTENSNDSDRVQVIITTIRNRQIVNVVTP